MTIIRNLIKLFNYEQIESNSNILKKISLLACEKIHIHFLKWALGVNRKASNAGAWGESGRYPLIYECISLTLKYFNRVKCLKNDSLVSLAYQEQRRLNLEWHKGIELILKIVILPTMHHHLDSTRTKHIPYTAQVHTQIFHPTQDPDKIAL